MPVVWTDDLQTGIDAIDQQHMQIVDCINDLEAAAAEDDELVVGEVLARLMEYTRSHFAFEEALQLQAEYKLAEPHKSIHDRFVKRLRTYQKRFRSGEDIIGQLRDMLTTWLLHHIKRDDRAYVADVDAYLLRLVRERSELSERGADIPTDTQ